MKYWLMKSEPDVFSIDHLAKSPGKTGSWEGVRNFQARNFMKAMKKGDLAFIYHSGDDKAVMGISKVLKEAYPDPKDQEWLAVDLGIDKKLKNPVTLAAVKATKKLADMVLVRVSRLSVQPVKPEEFDQILALSEGK